MKLKIIDKFRKNKNNNQDIFNYNSTLFHTVKLLKDYGISDIVVSPGMQNANFNSIVQKDPFFSCYSVVDERSAAYVACGIASQKQKPVVITCTEATASRNYLSAMTEAFYRNIPIIALTFYNDAGTPYNLSPQHVDRSITQNDIKTIKVDLPAITDWYSRQKALLLLNAAISAAAYKNEPVHINCPSFFDIEATLDFDTLDTWHTEFIFDDFSNLSKELENKRVAIFIGSHAKFDENTAKYIENFAQSWNAPVFYDHTSSYNGMRNGILSTKACRQILLKQYPDIVIDLGGVCSHYYCDKIFEKAEIWRISPNGKFSCRFSKPVKKHIVCSEQNFFFSNISQTRVNIDYYNEVFEQINNIKERELPLSNMLVCKYLSKYIPKNSILNISILNSLRSMNFFELDKSIDSVCNVGGFGIDGQVSTLVGYSIANKENLCFGLFGDLAFFYDMNVLGIRHVGKNIRIIVINNNKGEEFKLNPDLAENLGELTDTLIAAGGHYINGAKAWALSCGFEYSSVSVADGLEEKIKEFCKKDFGKSVLLEVKTNDADEKEALNIMTQIL